MLFKDFMTHFLDFLKAYLVPYLTTREVYMIDRYISLSNQGSTTCWSFLKLRLTGVQAELEGESIQTTYIAYQSSET